MASVEETLTELRSEVRHLQDREAVAQLIASYGPLVDTSDDLERSTRLAQLWTEDGVYDVGSVSRWSGRAEIAEGFVADHFAMVGDGVAHIMGLPFIEIDGDRATALCYSQVMVPENGRWFAWRVSANLWELTRTPEGWKVANRVNRLVTADHEAYGLQRTIDRLHAGVD
jgi:hypothetical protein